MHANNGPDVAHTTLPSQCRELMPTGDLPSAVHEGYHESSLLQHEMLLDVADGSFSTEAAPSACHLMSALLPNRHRYATASGTSG